MTCPRCQHENRAAAKFCEECSAPLLRLGGSAQPAPSYTDLQRVATEALDQQTATAEILRAMSGNPGDLEPVLNIIVTNAARVCGAHDASVHLLEAERLRLVAHHGPVPIIAAGRDMPLSRGLVGGRAVLDREPVHVHDVSQAEDFPEGGEFARKIGFKTILAVPLLRGGTGIGVVTIRRVEVHPFTDKQIALLQTFTDQAVIAIENVRLFNETKEALEQQTATAEILRVISSSPTDVQPVFDAIASRGARLCDADFCIVFRFDGTMITLAAHDGRSPGTLDVIRAAYPAPPGRRSISARTIFERRVVSIADAQDPSAHPPGFEGQADRARAVGYRSILAVPMLRDDAAIGAINVARLEVRPFSDREIALLQTFADQAVIAIENVRLFNETQEALEQQTATAEILRVISSSPTNIQPVFDVIAQSAARLCEAFDAVVYRVEGDALRPVTHHGSGEVGPLPLVPGTVNGRAVIERRLVHVTDVQAETNEFPEGATISRREGTRSMVSVPLLREGRGIGTIGVRRFEIRPFGEKQIALLRTFADQAVIAIENVRLFKELETRNRDLTVALDQQKATSEILQVISGSPTDIQPVFDTIARNASRLCGEMWTVVVRYDGEMLHLVADENPRIDPAEHQRRFPMPASHRILAARPILDRTIIHIPDVTRDPDLNQEAMAAFGSKATLGVPMMH